MGGYIDAITAAGLVLVVIGLGLVAIAFVSADRRLRDRQPGGRQPGGRPPNLPDSAANHLSNRRSALLSQRVSRTPHPGQPS